MFFNFFLHDYDIRGIHTIQNTVKIQPWFQEMFRIKNKKKTSKMSISPLPKTLSCVLKKTQVVFFF